MLKRLLRDSVIYALGRVASAVVAVFLLPLYTAYLRPAEFGLFDMGNLVMTLAALVVALEVAQGAGRYYCEEEDEQRRAEYFTTALLFTVAAFGVFWVLAVAAARQLALPVFGAGADSGTVTLVASGACAVALFRLGISQLRWQLRPKAYLSCALLQLAINTGLSAWLVAGVGLGAEGMLWGVFASNASGVVAALWLGRRGLGRAWSTSRLREMLAFSAPLVTSSAAVWVALYVDRLAVKELLTMADLGRYGIAYRFAATIDIIMAGFDMAFMPLIYAQYGRPETPSQIAVLLRRLLAGGIAVFLILAATAHELLEVLVSAEYRAAAPLVPVLAAGVFFMKLASLAPGLSIARRTGWIAFVNVLVAIVNLGLNLILIPRLGLIGACLATLTGALLGFTINMTLSQRLYAVPHDWTRLLAGGVAGAAGVLGIELLASQLPPFSAPGIASKLGCAAVTLVLCAAILVTRDEWRQLGVLVRNVGRERAHEDDPDE